jgi:peptide/nickel transport system substrate-binding protein
VKPARLCAVLLTVLTLALGLSGCGDDKGDKKSSGGATGPAAGENDINSVDRDKVADGGTLRWPVTEIPPNFNVNQLDGTLADNAAVMGGQLLGVFNFDARAEPVLNEDYFTSVDLTASSPKQVVTYKISPEAKWYDGTAITVADFEAHWKALNGTNEAFKVASTNGYEQIESVVKGADEREVVTTYKQPYADWRGLFGGLLPASTAKDPAIFNEGWRDKPLTTAGPFKFEGVDRTAKTITVVRNEKWWGKPAKLEKIIFRAIDANAQIDALANGEIDFIDIGPDVNKLKRAEGTPGMVLRRAGGPNFRHITINGTAEVIKDVNVRRALAMAINRETIAQALIGPLGITPKPLDNHIFMSNQKGYKDNAGELGKYDPEKAKAMLDAAGWKQQGDVRVKDGKQLAIRFVIPSQVASSKQESELVQQMLAGVGVKVNIETVPSDDFFEKYVTPGSFDFTVFSWLGTVFPISSSKSIYANPKPGPEGLEVQQNYARVGSDEIDQLYDKATSEFDLDKAAELANQIDALIWAEVHSLTLYQRPEIVASKANLANFGAFGFASVIFEDIGFTKS